MNSGLVKNIFTNTGKMGGLISYISASILQPYHSKPQLKSKLPLPSTIHATLDPSVIDNKALFIIGDVHGCYDEMSELIEDAHNATTKELVIVFVGDLINKGPKNKQVLDYVQTEYNVYSVRGNHDEAVLRHCLLHKSDKNYEIPTRYDWIKNLSCENINFLQELPYTIRIPSHNVIVVHAGLLPGIELEEQSLSDMVLMRNIIDRDYSDGGPHAAETDGRGCAWITRWTGQEHVYFGHDAVRKLQRSSFATGLDTGCVYGFYLTGAFVNKAGDVERLMQVKARHINQYLKDPVPKKSRQHLIKFLSK